MYKKFASQVGILILINLIIKLIWIFVIERKLQLTVGFENYGIYYSLFNFTVILSVITDPGLSNYLVRSLASKNNFKTKGLFSLKMLLSALFFIVTISAGLLLDYNINYIELLIILACYQVLWSILIYLRSFLKGFQLFNIEIFFSVFDKFLLIILLTPILYFNTDITINIYLFAIAQIIAVTISIILCIIALKRKKISIFTGTYSPPDFTALKKLWPFALFAFLVSAYNRIDVIMLDRLLTNGNYEAGIYAAAYRLLDASNMIAVLFASLFLPLVTKLIKEKSDISNFVKDSFGILISLSLIISFSSWFYQVEIMQLFYGQKNSEYLAQIFGVLMFGSPLIVLYYVYSTILTANNNLKILNLLSFAGLSLNIILNLILIPIYGALGVSYSAIITLLAVGTSLWLIYKTLFNVAINQVFSLKLTAFLVSLIVSGWFLKTLQINWILSLGLYVSVTLICASMLKLLSLQKITSLFKA